LNIAPRNFTIGFPGVQNRNEWFGIRYKGNFFVDSSDRYKFRLISDDGSRLLINDSLVINNDGLHSPRARLGDIHLARGYHKVQIDYFQGPARHICLILEIKNSNEEWKVFKTDEYSPFEIVEDEESVKIRIKSSILFKTNSSKLLDESVEALKELVEILKKYPSNDLLISGHTDNIGSTAYNYNLSLRRAKSVKTQFNILGYNNQNIRMVGYGESKPIESNDTPESRKQNRRVEIEIKK